MLFSDGALKPPLCYRQLTVICKLQVDSTALADNQMLLYDFLLWLAFTLTSLQALCPKYMKQV